MYIRSTDDVISNNAPITYLNSLFSIGNTIEDDAKAIIDLIDRHGDRVDLSASVTSSIDAFLLFAYEMSSKEFLTNPEYGKWPVKKPRLVKSKMKELKTMAQAYLL